MCTLVRCLVTLAAILCLAAEETNLLQNSALALADSAPNEWKGGGTFTADASNLPEGVAGAISTTIKGVAGSSHAQLTQRHPVAKADARYRITAWSKATVARCAYVQVKLYGADRKELKRITIGYAAAAWSKADGVVDASGASSIEVLLRWIPEPRYDAAKVWFAAPVLALTDAPATASKP